MNYHVDPPEAKTVTLLSCIATGYVCMQPALLNLFSKQKNVADAVQC